MKYFLPLISIFLIVLAYSLEVDLDQNELKEFKKWKREQRIYFSTYEEEQYRFNIFRKNFRKSQQANKKSRNQYRTKMNKFASLSEEEFAATHLTLKVPDHESIFHHQKHHNEFDFSILKRHRNNKNKNNQNSFTQYYYSQYSAYYSYNKPSLPTTLDLRKEQQVTSVKDQGQCGACWAFSAAGAMESCYYKKYWWQMDLSEQQLLDCVYTFDGCKEGGWMPDAFDWIERKNGITSERLYPYTGKHGSYCKSRSSYMYLDNWIRVTNDITSIKQALKDYGALSIAVDATKWYDYDSGIFTDTNLRPTPNHAANLVGYGLEGDQQYWIVKNCWGTDWGENGYIRLSFNDHSYLTQYTYAVECS